MLYSALSKHSHGSRRATRTVRTLSPALQFYTKRYMLVSNDTINFEIYNFSPFVLTPIKFIQARLYSSIEYMHAYAEEHLCKSLKISIVVQGCFDQI